MADMLEQTALCANAGYEAREFIEQIEESVREGDWPTAQTNVAKLTFELGRMSACDPEVARTRPATINLMESAAQEVEAGVEDVLDSLETFFGPQREEMFDIPDTRNGPFR